MSKYWLFYILRVQPQQKGKICNVCCKKEKETLCFYTIAQHFHIALYFFTTNIEDELMQMFLDNVIVFLRSLQFISNKLTN